MDRISGNTIYLNLWNAIEAVLREIFIALDVYIGKEESSQINNLNFHLEKGEP